jgi:hypothetical protein
MRARSSAMAFAIRAGIVSFCTLTQPAHADDAATSVAVAPQYGTTHVYLNPRNIDRFVDAFLGTFGGESTKQVVTNVTPTPSRTTSQLLRTPVGVVSLFGFRTPIPYPFGTERNGYLVKDLDAAVRAARAAGASVLVAPFPDPIGRDAVIQWPGGVNMQLYWHTRKSAFAALRTVPESRVYISPDSVNAFIRDYLRFSHGTVESDNAHAPGAEIGRPEVSYRRIRITSNFGRMVVFATDGHLPYPYGHELTGYEVGNLRETLAKARAAGVTVLVQPYRSDGRDATLVQFPGGYVAEIHSPAGQ